MPGAEDAQKAAQEEMKRLEEADEVPSDPKDWPDGEAKFLTFDVDSDEPYGEGATAKIGPGDVEHHADGSVTSAARRSTTPRTSRATRSRAARRTRTRRSCAARTDPSPAPRPGHAVTH